MPQPTPYAPTADFSADELANAGGRSTVRTAALDAELAGIATTLGGVLLNLALNQRDDGEIRDERVKIHTLAPEVKALLAAGQGVPRGAWGAAVEYALRDIVTHGGNTYICAAAHTSGTFAADLAAARWLLLAFGSAVAASGVPFTPTGTLAATTVQAAIEEADAENRTLSAAAVALLRSDLAATTAAHGAALVGFSHAHAYPAGTVGRALQHALNVRSSPFNASGDGTTDDTAAIQAALTASGGRPVYLPAGTYRITSSLTYEPASYTGAFGAGVYLYGDGEGLTVVDNQANGPALRLVTDSDGSNFFGALGASVEQLTIRRTTPTTGGVGIFATAAYNLLIRQVHIIGMSSHGVQIPCVLGDNDGSNMLAMDHVRIENCAGWGVKADGDAGRNETSFIRLQHVFIQGCGTASAAATPPSGGMIWKGQILTLDQCAFTLNQNCALFIPGQAGLGQTVDIQNTTFENNYKRNIYCTGISAFKARNIQQYHNDTYTGTVGIEFDGASFVVRQVDIDGCLVRATAGNSAFTAFKISGANADRQSCRVRRVIWDNFDFAGQTRFDGWLFDPVMPACDVVVLNSTTVFLRANQTSPRGSAMPMRLRGGIGGAPSTSGEWVAYQVPNPGLTISNAGLANSTRYYVYLFDNNGAPSLELSTTSFSFDTATGYAVKSGDSTRTYCGSVMTTAGGAFETTACGWLNPLLVPATQTGTYTYMWADSSGRVRVRYPLPPSSDTDGTVVGTQT